MFRLVAYKVQESFRKTRISPRFNLQMILHLKITTTASARAFLMNNNKIIQDHATRII